LLFAVGTLVNAQVVTEALRSPRTTVPNDVSTVSVPDEGARAVLKALTTVSVTCLRLVVEAIETSPLVVILTAIKPFAEVASSSL